MGETNNIKHDNIVLDSDNSSKKKKSALSKYVLMFLFFIFIFIFFFVGYFALQLYVDSRFMKEIRKIESSLGVQLNYEKVRIGIFSKNLVVKKLELKKDENYISVREVVIDNLPKVLRVLQSDDTHNNSNDSYFWLNSKPDPNRITIHIQDVNLQLSEFWSKKIGIPLSELGLDSLNGNMAVSFLFKNEIFVFNVDDSYFEDVGRLRGILVLGGFKKDFSVSSFLTRIVLEAGITFHDNGLANRIMDVFAKDTVSTPEKVKDRVLDGINRRMLIYYKDDRAKKSILTSVYRFFEHPDILSVVYVADKNTRLIDLFPKDVKGWRSLMMWFSKQPYIVTSS